MVINGFIEIHNEIRRNYERTRIDFGKSEAMKGY